MRALANATSAAARTTPDPMLIPEQVAESLGHLLAIYATARAAGGDATALASRCPDSCRSPDRRRIPAVAVERRSNDSGRQGLG